MFLQSVYQSSKFCTVASSDVFCKIGFEVSLKVFLFTMLKLCPREFKLFDGDVEILQRYVLDLKMNVIYWKILSTCTLWVMFL